MDREVHQRANAAQPFAQPFASKPAPARLPLTAKVQLMDAGSEEKTLARVFVAVWGTASTAPASVGPSPKLRRLIDNDQS